MTTNDWSVRFRTELARVYARYLLLLGHEIVCNFDSELICFPIQLDEDGYCYMVSISFSDTDYAFSLGPFGEAASDESDEPCEPNDALCAMIARINHERVNCGAYTHFVYNRIARTWRAVAALSYDPEEWLQTSCDMETVVKNLLYTVVVNTERLADAAHGYVGPTDDLNAPVSEDVKRKVADAIKLYWKNAWILGKERFETMCMREIFRRNGGINVVSETVEGCDACVKLRFDFEGALAELNEEYTLPPLRKTLYDALQASSRRNFEIISDASADAADSGETGDNRAEPRGKQEEQKYRNDGENDDKKKEG